jgi:hypothetical protein
LASLGLVANPLGTAANSSEKNTAVDIFGFIKITVLKNLKFGWSMNVHSMLCGVPPVNYRIAAIDVNVRNGWEILGPSYLVKFFLCPLRIMPLNLAHQL